MAQDYGDEFPEELMTDVYGRLVKELLLQL